MKTTPRPRGFGRSFHSFGREFLILFLSVLLLNLPLPAFAAPGDLDPSFDGDGLVLTDLGQGFDLFRDLVVQPDGKLVAAGETADCSFGNCRRPGSLVRYNQDGSLDASFGVGGRVVTGFYEGGGLAEDGRRLAVQPDGKLVVGGSAPSIVALTRFNPDGSPDASFGIGGRVAFPEGPCCAVVVQPDGKLIVGSRTYVRLNPDGTRDASFGNGQSVLGEVSSMERVLQPDGKLVAAGTKFGPAGGPFDADFALERFNPDGSPDLSFGSGGVVLLAFGEESRGSALVLQPDGKLVAAGSIGRFTAQDRLLARFLPDGSLDTSFGNGGVVVTDGGDSSFGWGALVLQSDGKQIAGGMLDRRGGLLLARHNPDGSPDASFGSGGIVAFFGTDSSGGDFDFFGSIFGGIALHRDGKLVAGGSVFSGIDSDLAVARFVTTTERPKRPPKCDGRRATILGTAGNDILRGTSGRDVILGRGGNDTIRGLAGDDTICGGPGRDQLIGNEGNDRLFGEDGNDRLFGDSGSDVLDGGKGRNACGKGEETRNCGRKAKPRERPQDPPKPPCPPVGNFPCS